MVYVLYSFHKISKSNIVNAFIKVSLSILFVGFGLFDAAGFDSAFNIGDSSLVKYLNPGFKLHVSVTGIVLDFL